MYMILDIYSTKNHWKMDWNIPNLALKDIVTNSSHVANHQWKKQKKYIHMTLAPPHINMQIGQEVGNNANDSYELYLLYYNIPW